MALEIVRAFVAAMFTGKERHRRRLKKVLESEELERSNAECADIAKRRE